MEPGVLQGDGRQQSPEVALIEHDDLVE